MKHIKPYLFEAKASKPKRRVEYYEDGRVKREEWYLNDKWHREDGPAVIWYYENGQVEYEGWYLNGKRHREDGPAYLEYYEDGQVKYEGWYLNGNMQREDGPAGIKYYENGRVKAEEWWLNDKQLTQAEWEASSPKTPVERLVQIAQGKNERTAVLAKQNPNYPSDLPGWAINLDDWS